MMRLHYFVNAICLVQAVAMCFVLSPIKALTYSATTDAPAVWWILAPDTAWLSLRCFDAANPLSCFQTIGEIFQLGKALSLRIGISVVAVAAGLLSFHWISAKLSRVL